MNITWPWSQKRKSDIVWLDLGDLGDLVHPNGPHEQWQDHGLGLLRTILHQNGIETDILSTRAVTSWEQLAKQLPGYKMMLMNVRSYTYPVALKAAQIFKEINPQGMVMAGGMHATVAPDEMEQVREFDKICKGPGEEVIVDLVRDPDSFPRVFLGRGSKSMADWPAIDRELWPKPANWKLRRKFNWPLEPECGWGPPPVATIITSRVCPWQCVFCNEASYIPNMGRKPVDAVIDELNFLDKKYGVGSVVIHDSMFFQNPSWLKEWVEKYPRHANKVWPYWAAGRADTVRQWPDLFEALVRETNWNLISIGFESGSDRILKLLNKECTEEDNYFAIDLLNRIGDEMVAEGKEPPKFWSNIMLGIPGESKEDAFKTMRMLKRMKRVFPSISYYAPYPGSALGFQLIAEGKSMMSKDNYHRFPDDEKVKGVDYSFYRELLAGKYDAEVNSGLPESERRRGYQGLYAEALVKA
ncbi:MAG: B12-binding domain-containing radical SAM protein [Caldilineaceae bacterium]|nr:B12-binding domain-containing radical SAM protein [Caldilineaceae bacterium]